MALMYAKLAEGKIGPSERAFHLMSANPEMIAGSDRFDTDLMKTLSGRAVSKIGAEGIRCLGIRGNPPIGIALKIDDGSGRALAAVMLEVLAQLDLMSQAELNKLSKYRKPIFKNNAGIETGFINVNFKL